MRMAGTSAPDGENTVDGSAISIFDDGKDPLALRTIGEGG